MFHVKLSVFEQRLVAKVGGGYAHAGRVRDPGPRHARLSLLASPPANEVLPNLPVSLRR